LVTGFPTGFIAQPTATARGAGNPGHREFAMAHGEMSREEFAAFNRAWMAPAMARLIEGGLLATFIDWRSVALVIGSGFDLGLTLLNLVVWAKSNGGQGSLWRSQHELLPVFKKGAAPHINNVELGRHGRWRSNVWTYPGGSSLGSDSREGLDVHPTVKPRADYILALKGNQTSPRLVTSRSASSSRTAGNRGGVPRERLCGPPITAT